MSKRFFILAGVFLALAVGLTVAGIWVPDWTHKMADNGVPYWKYNADQRWYLTGVLALGLSALNLAIGVALGVQHNDREQAHNGNYNHPFEPNKKGVCVNCILRNDRELAG